MAWSRSKSSRPWQAISGSWQRRMLRTTTRSACVYVASSMHPCKPTAWASYPAKLFLMIGAVQEAKTGAHNASNVGGGGINQSQKLSKYATRQGPVLKCNSTGRIRHTKRAATHFPEHRLETMARLGTLRLQHTFGCHALVATKTPCALCLGPVVALRTRSRWGARWRMGVREFGPKEQARP